jgi:hypothetical protein
LVTRIKPCYSDSVEGLINPARQRKRQLPLLFPHIRLNNRKYAIYEHDSRTTMGVARAKNPHTQSGNLPKKLILLRL